jgi:hypothetical protein
MGMSYDHHTRVIPTVRNQFVAVFDAGDEIQLTCAYFQGIILVLRVAVLWLSL